MQLILVPSTVTLSSQLLQRTGLGYSEEEIRETELIWEYSIPPLNQSEFYYEGTLEDTSVPIFSPLNYTNTSQCYVRQLPGRAYTNPAFELEFSIEDKQSLLDVSFQVGSFLRGADLLAARQMGGRRIVIPTSRIPAGQHITFTVLAANQNGLQTYSTCSLHAFDKSPPLARINPIKPFSSHPSKMEALVVLFDEYKLDDVLSIAVGSIHGPYGNDVMEWTPFDTTSIDTPPPMPDAISLFSFPRVRLKVVISF